MLYIVLRDGRVDELADATATVARDGSLVCRDALDREVVRYGRGTVLTYGTTERLKALAEEYRNLANRLAPAP
jgi:hypothetical protein